MEAVLSRPSYSPDNSAFNSVSDLLDGAVADGVFPGAVLSVAQDGRTIFEKVSGVRALVNDSPDAEEGAPAPSAPMELGTVFDLAGLSASLITTTILMKLVEDRRIKLSDRVSHFIQGFGVLNKSPITVAQVLGHTSGLVAWYPFFEDLLRENSTARMGIITSRGARDYVANAINRSELKYPTNSKQVYSDVGYVLLGFLIESLTGVGLDKAAQRILLQPLGLKSTSYIDLSLIKRRGIHPVADLIAPTEQCPWRKRVLCGEVHDDNAWAMGGIAGHAGLFSSAQDIQQLCSRLLNAYAGKDSYLKADSIKAFWSGVYDVEGASWRLGWDSPSKENGMNESLLSSDAVGCNGFTGCSLWMEPEQGLSVLLLSNRVHPTRNNKKILTFRPLIHRAVMEALKK